MKCLARVRMPSLLLPLVFALACGSAPKLPDGSGPGLVAFDPAAPASTQVFEPPEWHVGDAFTLLRGGRQRIEFRVAAATDDGYLLVDGNGNRLQRGRDLSNIGEWGPAVADEPNGPTEATALHALTPPDVRFHWPLWVGKRWRCQYSDRTAGGNALPIESAYEVEDLDTVDTPAGTFRALRIVRTSRLRVDGGSGGTFLDRVNLIWYAPDIGLEVRQVFGDTAVELVEWRSSAPPAAR